MFATPEKFCLLYVFTIALVSAIPYLCRAPTLIDIFPIFPTLPILLTAIPKPPSSLTTENCQLKTVNCQLMFFVFLCLNNQSLMFFRL